MERRVVVAVRVGWLGEMGWEMGWLREDEHGKERAVIGKWPW
jgi:glycine cleavage system aminomethyltransferase T